MPDIERSRPEGATHELTSKVVLDSASESMQSKAKMVGLAEYLRDVAGKPRGTSTGGKEDLNSHTEEFIIKDNEGIRVRNLQELQAQLTELGAPFELLGVESIGNPNQKVSAVGNFQFFIPLSSFQHNSDINKFHSSDSDISKSNYAV